MMACVFSGQGAQKPGMGFDLYESDPAAREIYRIAENVLGRDLLTLDEQQLVQTRFAQPAIVAMSLSVWSAFVRQAPKVSVMAFAGFSLGEYSALGAAGVLELPDLLALVLLGAILIPVGFWVFSMGENYAMRTGKLKRTG